MTANSANPNEFKLNLEIHTLSDWQIGSGEGRYGIYDSLIARNAADLPFIPNTTMRGMLRDAAEHVAHALGSDCGWPELVTSLFGSEPSRLNKKQFKQTCYKSPTTGCIHISSAEINDNLAAHLCGSSANAIVLRRQLTFAKPGVKVDRTTGMSESNMLRFDELARKGMILHCKVCIDAPEDRHEALSAFFQAITMVFDRVGGKRRRGQGAVKLCITDGVSGENAAKYLSENSTAPRINAPFDDLATGSPASIEAFDSIPFDIKLTSPCLVGGEVRGNIVTGESFIPGYVLLPIIRRLLMSSDLNAGELIANGQLRVSCAYLKHEEKRCIPTPVSWRIKKSGRQDGGKEVIDLANPPDSLDAAEQLKRIGQGYYFRGINDGEIIPLSPAMVTRTHNTIDDAAQRPTSVVGGVYVYEALAEGQSFKGRIEIAKGTIANVLLAERTIRLGRAKSAGYGEAVICFGSIETPDRRGSHNADKELDIIFTSDTIIAGEDPISLAGITNEIARLTGIDANKFDLNLSSASLRPKTIRSWSTKWNLPRPEFMTIAAGSVAKIVLTRSWKTAELDKLKGGLGERLVEGFGRIDFGSGSPTIGTLKFVDTGESVQDSVPELPAIDEVTKGFSELLENMALKESLQDRLQQNMNEISQEILEMDTSATTPKPPMSQLGGLRNVVLAAQDGEIVNDISSFFAGVKENSKRHAKWGNKADKWLDLLVRNECTALWEKLGIDPPTLSSSLKEIQRRLNEYVVSTTVMTIIKHHKRNIENSSRERQGEDE